MKYFKYLFLASILVFSFSSKSYNTTKQPAPNYKLEVIGLNSRITNKLSDFANSLYIQKQINHFRKQWGLHGVSVAVVKDEKLVYAQGFGQADSIGSEVEAGSLFRVASVSKLLTAIGVMRLVDDNKLKLDDTVFGPEGIIKDSVFNEVADKRLYQVTVRHLLAHAGGWTQRAGDPAFNSILIAEKVGDPLPATIQSYFKFVATRRLSFTPGSQSVYSNMGYMFLGEVIAAASGKSYESYIREDVLEPIGILDMHIGNSYQTARLENEVCYFQSANVPPIPAFNGSGNLVDKTNGGNPIELLSAAGGWICSAVELARLISYIDGKPEVKDILSENSIAEMTNSTYARGPLGWKTALDNGNWIRTGNMAGTSAMIKRQADGLTWVFLSNTSSWKGASLANDISGLMARICLTIKEWPQHDLFTTDQLSAGFSAIPN
ncbi:MAG: serine hydrolase domain-containing protein [Mangrovibacterium sp.]